VHFPQALADAARIEKLGLNLERSEEFARAFPGTPLSRWAG
jgi:hypothetical protein